MIMSGHPYISYDDSTVSTRLYLPMIDRLRRHYHRPSQLHSPSSTMYPELEPAPYRHLSLTSSGPSSPPCRHPHSRLGIILILFILSTWSFSSPMTAYTSSFVSIWRTALAGRQFPGGMVCEYIAHAIPREICLSWSSMHGLDRHEKECRWLHLSARLQTPIRVPLWWIVEYTRSSRTMGATAKRSFLRKISGGSASSDFLS
jgi:hypothetical protein